MDSAQIAQVRRFNRVATERAGALSERFLGRKRPLRQARLLWEIGRSGANVRDLRARLGLDSGYLSRLLRSLEAEGLILVRPSASDRRVRRATLTSRGEREWDELEARSEALAASVPRAAQRAVRARARPGDGDGRAAAHRIAHRRGRREPAQPRRKLVSRPVLRRAARTLRRRVRSLPPAACRTPARWRRPRASSSSRACAASRSAAEG